MKIKRYINMLSVAAMFVACAATLTGCNDNDFTWDEYWLDGEDEQGEGENPNNPDNPNEPTYDFQLMSKNVKVDPSVRFQTMEGIGASDCWLPNIIGKHWTSNRGKIAELLFSQEINNGQPKGIGLSTWRVNLGAGTEELGEAGGISDENKNNRAPSYVTVSSTADNLTYDWNKCEGQRYFMEQAKNMGVEGFVFFVNSPLVQFTKNGKGVSSSGEYSNLKEDCYDKFAEYLATVSKHFEDMGYNITHISPANEPQHNWDGDNQEGSGWLNTQIARMARELDKALEAKGSKALISLGETAHWDAAVRNNDRRENTIERLMSAQSDAYVGDVKRVDNICAHSYFTDGNWASMREMRQMVADRAAQYDAKLWQTEWSMLVSGANHYGDILNKANPFDIAQWMCAVIHNDFTVAGVTAWHFWTAISVERWSQMDRFMLVNCTPAGGQYDNDFTREGTVEDFRTLWALGNYSRFVRPGYQRIDLKMIESENFFGDGWISPDGKTIVCVYTNRQKERGVKLKVSYADWGSEVASISKYTTTEEKNLEGTDCDVRFPVVCEPYSVTTVVYNLK